MSWKYVVMRVKSLREGIEGGIEYDFPVIFPDKLVHQDVSDHLRHLIGRTMSGFSAKPVSAGSIEHLEVLGLGGDSETLLLKSRPGTDKELIEGFTYNHGIVS